MAPNGGTPCPFFPQFIAWRDVPCRKMGRGQPTFNSPKRIVWNCECGGSMNEFIGLVGP